MRHRDKPIECRFDGDDCHSVDCSTQKCRKQKFARVLEEFTPDELAEAVAIIERMQKGKLNV